MKKICFSIECINVCGGTERVTSQLASALSDKYDISILSIEKLSDSLFFEMDEKIKIDYLFNYQIDDNLKKHYFEIVKRIRKYLKNNKINILVTVDVSQLLFISLATVGLNIKVIAWEQFNSARSKESKVAFLSRKIASNRCDCIVTLTKEDREKYIELFSPKAKVQHIYNPLTPSLLNKKNNSVKDNTIISVGRLQYQKGFDMLLEVANILFNEYRVSDWNWIIVGEGTKRKELEKKIQEYDLEKKVLLLGEQRDVSSYLNDSKIFVLTSRYEGFGLVIVEAQYFDLPVISFDCDMGPRELIKEGKNGYLIPCYDIRLMAKKIYELIRDSQKVNEFSENATINIDQFNFGNIVNNWIDLIENIESE